VLKGEDSPRSAPKNGAASGQRIRKVAPLYVLTIVFLLSQVSITSLHASQDACELAAERARMAKFGPQAVGSARCELQAPVVAAK